MDNLKARLCSLEPGVIVRRLIIAWLAAVTIEFVTLPKDVRSLDGLLWFGSISPVRIAAVGVLVFALLTFLHKVVSDKASAPDAENGGTKAVSDADKLERFIMAAVFFVLAAASLITSFSIPFAVTCVLLSAAFIIYSERGADTSPVNTSPAPRGRRVYLVIVIVLTAAFILFDSVWTICRINGFVTPTFDFGIFAQMFYYMKTTGVPFTTLERDVLLSHFAVHLSPIYYLLLPFYMIAPYPATIQVMQAVVLASAVIPLWKLCRKHGLSDVQRTLICAMWLLYPALSGGTGYDIHENCFLAPLILWLLYGIDKKSTPVITVSLLLTLAVKEDAAVYCAVIALYLIVRAVMAGTRRNEERKCDRRDLITGVTVLAVSLVWFVLASRYINIYGDGTLANDRYPNFLLGDSSPLVNIIKSALICPMKIVRECVEAEKLKFIAQTMLPLLALPLLTRRYERYILLLPYIIVNLVSDYIYLHDIFFQYTFGSTACLFYLAAVNLADLRLDVRRITALTAAAAVTAAMFGAYVVPRASGNISRAVVYSDYFDELRETLDVIPADASVTATSFYTTYLSQRDEIYDVRRYYSKEHMHVLETDYVVLTVDKNGTDAAYRDYGGYDNLLHLLRINGYEQCAEFRDTIVIYKKSSAGAE